MKKMIVLIFLIIFTQILSTTPIIQQDHVLHFAGSAFLTYWSYEFSGDVFHFSHKKSLFYSVNLTALLGIGKETSDKHIKKTKFSWKDVSANALGIVAGVIIIQQAR
jgi:uncharacterized protein YfiM (DUF2279 family)